MLMSRKETSALQAKTQKELQKKAVTTVNLSHQNALKIAWGRWGKRGKVKRVQRTNKGGNGNGDGNNGNWPTNVRRIQNRTKACFRGGGGRGHDHVRDMDYALSEMNCRKLFPTKRPIKAEIKKIHNFKSSGNFRLTVADQNGFSRGLFPPQTNTCIFHTHTDIFTTQQSGKLSQNAPCLAIVLGFLTFRIKKICKYLMMVFGNQEYLMMVFRYQEYIIKLAVG